MVHAGGRRSVTHPAAGSHALGSGARGERDRAVQIGVVKGETGAPAK